MQPNASLHTLSPSYQHLQALLTILRKSQTSKTTHLQNISLLTHLQTTLQTTTTRHLNLTTHLPSRQAKLQRKHRALEKALTDVRKAKKGVRRQKLNEKNIERVKRAILRFEKCLGQIKWREGLLSMLEIEGRELGREVMDLERVVGLEREVEGGGDEEEEMGRMGGLRVALREKEVGFKKMKLAAYKLWKSWSAAELIQHFEAADFDFGIFDEDIWDTNIVQGRIAQLYEAYALERPQYRSLEEGIIEELIEWIQVGGAENRRPIDAMIWVEMTIPLEN